MALRPIFLPASDSSFLLRFGEGISPEIHRRVLQATRILLSSKLPSIRNLHPAYDSILVSFDPLKVSHAQLEVLVKSFFESESGKSSEEENIKEIATCYGGEFGPDLSDVAKYNGLSEQEVVEIHSSVLYTVYFLGFSPGFPYLGGLSDKIAIPRLSTPRMHVPGGSVAIGGNQTGIYPLDSPGGWRIIGRTPARLFDPSADPPTILQMGDRVRFVPISIEQFRKHTTY
jgi:KipI family sensor histidine kinase inhibitor